MKNALKLNQFSSPGETQRSSFTFYFYFPLRISLTNSFQVFKEKRKVKKNKNKTLKQHVILFYLTHRLDDVVAQSGDQYHGQHHYLDEVVTDQCQ